jgi:hypothetical protein
MLTRREFLLGLSLAPVLAKLPLCERALRPRMELWPEDHWLSVESASGFQALLHRELSAIHTASRHCDLVSLIILPGTRGITMERCEQLLRRMQEGAWIILETGSCFSSLEESKQQTSLVERTFNLEVFPPVRVCESSAKDNYVAYEWPIRRLVRTFEATTPLRCNRDHCAFCRAACMREEKSWSRRPGVSWLDARTGSICRRARGFSDWCRDDRFLGAKLGLIH